ncbi:MAG: von Willebrand factor type A domain-containing protein [Haliscomenobacter sp.]|nr:von Willebrand factor type A domain-containing protein [Haliscomenobacter sp.]
MIQNLSFALLLGFLAGQIPTAPGSAPTRYTVTGIVLTPDGRPLAYTAISAENETDTVYSSATGEFSLGISQRCVTLVATHLSYGTLREQNVCSGQKVSLRFPAEEFKEAMEFQQISLAMTKSRQSLPSSPSYAPASAPYSGAAPRLMGEPLQGWNTEEYGHIQDNRFRKVGDDPLSTFSIDVDAASYSNLRRFLKNGQMPPADAVRIEEMVNYFTYDYEQPNGEHPFAVYTELGPCPWQPKHNLLAIGLQGKRIPAENLPPSNLVFLIDVSGSMDQPNKLPLLKASFKLLADQLREQDRVAIVVYAGAAGLVLPPTPGSDKQAIKAAIDKLEAGGSTAGGAGIQLAYRIAKENLAKNGNNRVILATDGDFNVGISSEGELVRLIEKERESGVFLTALGFGMGNYKDHKMQELADKGNGNHYYIDEIEEAKKVLVREFGGTLFAIAKDVKLQIEFNSAKIQGYRLIGYENRLLAKEDFNDDQKDAGEMGAGHTVTALYEIIPVGVETNLLGSVDPLKYQKEPSSSGPQSASREWLNIKLRYKEPQGTESRLLEKPVAGPAKLLNTTSENFRWAASVAEFGMLLRQSEFKGEATYAHCYQLAQSAAAKESDTHGYRREFLQMIDTAMKLGKPELNADKN